MASAHITVSGFLARDAEVDATPSGTSVLKLTIPVNNPKDRNDTSWYRCSLFGKRADALYNLGLTKGTPVVVFGKLVPRTYVAKDGTRQVSLDVLADDVDLSGKREQSDEAPF